MKNSYTIPRNLLDGIEAFLRVAERRGITWTILPPGAGLVAKLDAQPGWHRLAADRG